MKHLQKIAGGLVMFLILTCCSSDETPDLSSRDHEYFPLQKGVFQIYDVNEIIYTLGIPETLAYELKTIVADSFMNNTGDYTYVIHRSKRTNGSADWQPLDTWSARLNTKEVVVNEGNIPFKVLDLPITKGNEWDGNLYNNLENPPSAEKEDLYSVQSKGESYTPNSEVFNDCVVIMQEDEPERIVFYDTRFEVYSRDIGLIYKEKIQLSYCAKPECIGQEKVDSGIIYKQTIKEYGNE